MACMSPKILLISLIFFTLSSCKSKKNTHSQNNSAQIENSVAMQNNAFAFDILKASYEENQNLIISPYSISAALAMTYAGAREETAAQISRTLHFSSQQETFHPEFSYWMKSIAAKGSKNDQFTLANSLWYQKDYHFVPSFFDLIKKHYGSVLHEVDFMGNREKIRLKINQWVAENTNNLIKNLIEPGTLTEDTRMILVNSIYFLANWDIAFNKEATRPGKFHLHDKTTTSVPFMYMKDSLKYHQGDNYQVLELEYSGGDFSMVLILPSDTVYFADFITSIQNNQFKNIVSSLEKKEVEVLLPSFKSRSKFNLEDVLSRMGMPIAFTNRANFSNMSQKDDLKIDKVIHEAFIEVKEEGTEAAASTAVIIVRKTAVINQEKNIFKADRPFLYAIKENTDHSILFLGVTADPSKNNE